MLSKPKKIIPKKKLGQNFLTDPNIRRKIIEAADFGPEDIVLEIGAGKGEITRLISQKVKQVYALEIDRSLKVPFEDNICGCRNVELINQDVLKFDLTELIKENPSSFKVFGNIPYYITTPIIQRLLEFRDKISSIFITVQKEFAQRAAAAAGDDNYGALSCFIQYYTQPKAHFVIKRGSFFPVPKVDSCFLQLLIRKRPAVEVADEGRLFKIIRSSFNQRRKTLRNSLEGVVAEDKLDLFFRESSIAPGTRPEQLSLADFANLANI